MWEKQFQQKDSWEKPGENNLSSIFLINNFTYFQEHYSTRLFFFVVRYVAGSVVRPIFKTTLHYAYIIHKQRVACELDRYVTINSEMQGRKLFLKSMLHINHFVMNKNYLFPIFVVFRKCFKQFVSYHQTHWSGYFNTVLQSPSPFHKLLCFLDLIIQYGFLFIYVTYSC